MLYQYEQSEYCASLPPRWRIDTHGHSPLRVSQLTINTYICCLKGKRCNFPCPSHEGIWGTGVRSPLIFTLGTWREWLASRPGSFIPGKGSRCLLNGEDGWAPQPLWTFCRAEKSLSLAGVRIPDFPVRSVSYTTTTISRLLSVV
jgi:hypothetical protein